MVKLIKYSLMFLRMCELRVRFLRGMSMHGFLRIGKGNYLSVRDGGTLNVDGISTGRNVTISAPGGHMKIGRGVSFNDNCYVVSRFEIAIGEGSLFGPNVVIVDHDHCFDERGLEGGYKYGKINIGSRCWLGANVVILRGTNIGDGCVIGAGTVVKGEIPAHSLVTAGRGVTISPITKQISRQTNPA